MIVIGSGPCGAIAALTLLNEGIPVTMLESGEHFPGGLLIRVLGRNVYRRRPPLAANQDHAASDDAEVVWYRSLALGGLSNYWTGAVPRFTPEDFFEGERLHARYRWPVSYDELVPYYVSVERLMGITGSTESVPNLTASRVAFPRRLPAKWQGVAARAQARGHGLVPLPMADVKRTLVTRSGAAFNTFTRIVPLLHHFSHFRLLPGAHALRLEWNGRRRIVDSVIYFDRITGSEQRVRGSAVVVAGGPLASTKLLLDSDSADFPEGLGNTAGLLGRYLHDHPKDWSVLALDQPLPRLGHAAYFTRAPYAESAPLHGAQSVIGNSGSSSLEKLLTFTPLPSRMFGVLTFGTMIPTPDNYVEQHPLLKDEFGLPALNFHIRYGEEVLPVLAAARERLAEVLEDASYHAEFLTPLSPPQPGTSVHYAGSVRMHHSPSHGMLNGFNRLHAVDNVVVADASCFTTGVEKNPLLTSMALSARAADRLAEDLKSGGVSGSSRIHSVA